MLLKSADGKGGAVAALEALLDRVPATRRADVEKDLRILKAGIKAENDAAYLIDFDYKPHENYVVIHDLRLEIGGRVAQIDHLLLNRRLECFVLETKSFNAGLKITEEGEFLRYDKYKKVYEGVPSPLQQNIRHIAVLEEAFDQVKLPTRLGFRLKPTFHSYVLVSKDANIERPTKFDTSHVVKMDALRASIIKQIDNESIMTTVVGTAKLVDIGTLVAIGRQLMAMHQPSTSDFTAKYDHLLAAPPAAKPSTGPLAAAATVPYASPIGGPTCKDCGAGTGTIAYGKYGYYFACGACAKNTAVRVECATPGHKARVRKEGPRFFQECADCGTSVLYFENGTPTTA